MITSAIKYSLFKLFINPRLINEGVYI